MKRETGSPLASLSNRNFRLYFFGYWLSQIGDWIQITALTVLVFRLSPSGVALGVMNVARFGPILVLGPFAGVLADRVDLWRYLRVVQLLGALPAAGLVAVVALDAGSLVLVDLLAVAAGVAQALESPARRSFISDLVPDELVSSAVGLGTATVTAAKAVGPAVAGAIIATVGIGWCFALNVATYPILFLLLARMDKVGFREVVRVPSREPRQLRAGLRHVMDTPALLLPFIVLFGVGSLSFNYQVILPVFTAQYLDGADTTFSLLFAALGAGSVVGSVSVARIRVVRVSYLVRETVLFGLVSFGMSMTRALWSSSLLLLLVGYASVRVVTMCQVIVQVRTVPAYRGRVLALVTTVFLASTPVGAPILGAISTRWGAATAIAVGAAFAASTAFLLQLRIHRLQRAAG